MLLLRHAEAIVARLDAARADIAALRAGETGTLRVGTYQSIGARVLPGVMRRFLADWPGIELGLSEPATDPELYAPRRVRRARSRVLQPAAARRAVRGARADERPVRPRRARRQPARPQVGRRRSTTSATTSLIGANTCSSGLVVEDDAPRPRLSRSTTPSSRTTTGPCRASSPPASASPSSRCSPSLRPATSASACSASAPRCRGGRSPSPGTATGTGRPPRGHSSRSRGRSAPRSSATSSSRRASVASPLRHRRHDETFAQITQTYADTGLLPSLKTLAVHPVPSPAGALWTTWV